jgi:serpin B
MHLLIFLLFLVGCTPAASVTPSEQPGETELSADPETKPSPAGTQSVPTEAPQIPKAQSVRADLPRINASNIPPEQQAQLVNGINTFAFDLYNQMQSTKSGNWIYSPYSISMAFSMVYAGAHGNTEAQMADVLHFLPQDAQHPAFNLLDQHITSLGKDDSEGEPFELTVANSTWGQQDFPFEQAFLEILAQHYGAGMEAVDFTTDPTGVANLINQWAAGQTNNKIEKIIPPDALNPLTRLVLANAIYFKAAWADQFEKEKTSDESFTLVDGTQVMVPTMHGNPTVPYMEGDSYKAVTLPYNGHTVSMVLIVPNPGEFEAVAGELSADFLNRILEGSSSYMVNLAVPKFDFDMDINLKDELVAMGLTDAFSDGADLTGIGEDLIISDALHKATITLDEEGTEAAAVTAVIVGVTSMPQTVDLTIDRPFIFAIVERESGTILFMGRVMDPSK